MQTKRKEWEEHIKAWQSSESSQRDYCQDHGLSLSGFGYWRRKLTNQPEGSSPSRIGVIPIRVQSPVVAEGLTVSLPNGIVLRAPSVDEALLGSLLRALSAC
jgi:hypothetical protein